MIFEKPLYPLSYVTAPTPLSVHYTPFLALETDILLKKIFPLCFANVLLGFHKICLIFLLKSIFFPFLLLVIDPQ